MITPAGGRAVTVAAVLALLLVPAGGGAAPKPGPAARPFHATLDEEGRTVLNVDAPALRQLAADGAFTARGVALDADTTVDLELERFTVISPQTRFVVGNRGGEDAEFAFDPDRVTLLRGHVTGVPRSHVYLAVSEWGSVGRIELGPGAPTFYAAGADGVSLRLSSDPAPAGLLPDVPLCGVETAGVRIGRSEGASPLRGGGSNPAVTQQIELALETDYELFEIFGSLEATGAYITELWGAVSDIYLRDVNTRIHVVFVRLWDDPDDVINGPDPFSEFVNEWSKNMTHVDRDVAQFVSGRRDFPYGGAATLETLCTSSAYGVAGYIIGTFNVDAPGIFAYDVQVTGHELGHNCGSLHTHDYGIDTCDDVLGVAQRGAIMSYCSQTRSGANANTDIRFHAIPQSFMEAHIFTAPCIAEDCNGNTVPDNADIAFGTSADLNGNGIPDECEDCNDNQVLDPTDILMGTSDDDNANGVPDECEPDCNGNGQPDDLDIQLGVDTDLYGNNIPDGCEVDCDGNGTSDYTDIQADMTLDLDRNAVLDQCQDCDSDGTPDLDELAGAHNVWVASSVAGSSLREFLAFTGVRVREAAAGLLSDPQDLIITASGRVLVSSGGDDRVVEFDAAGAHVGDLVAAGGGGLDFPTGLVVAPGGTLLVGSRESNEVLEYDAVSGAFLGAFVTAGSGGLAGPWGLAFGLDGDLFVTSNDNRVIQYDGSTGAPIGDFVSAGDNGGLNDPHGVLFKPNGNLLVASRLTDQILEFDSLTGAFLGQFNHGGTDTVLTMDEPWTLRLGPDGDVYASRHDVIIQAGHGGGLFEDDIQGLHINSTRIYIFDVDSGNFVRSYLTGHDTELELPTGFDFLPGDATDCNFNQLPDSCDIASGTSLDVNGNDIPDECEVICTGDLDGSGTVNVDDFLMLLAAWGPCPPGSCPADLDDDGDVDVMDFLALLAAWGPCP